MPTVTLKAHFDGKHIVLDEPFAIPANASLTVTVLSPLAKFHDAENTEWEALALQCLADAYGESEPEYSLGDVRP